MTIKKMEEKNNQTKKELTLEDLAAMMTTGFKESRESTKKLIDEKIEWLGRTTQESFLSVEGRLDGVEKRLDGVEKRLDGVEIDIKEIKKDTETIKANLNKKVDVVIHNELVYRVEKTEEKLGLKPKLKFA
jgi:hypothetical protein